MSNPIKNLGDYAEIVKELKPFNGDMNALYKSIGKTAVAKETPKILALGAGLTLAIVGTAYGGYRLVRLLTDRKKKIANEPALKEEFAKGIEAEIAAAIDEESDDVNPDNGNDTNSD